MTTLAADTWGISGPRFLLYYVAAAVVAFLVSGVIRRALAGGAIRSGWQPTAEHLAYFSGGPRQAVLATLAGLRVDQAVSAGPGGSLTVTGRVSPAPSPLTWAVYQAAQRGGSARTVATDPALKPALTDLRASLVGNGWLLTSARRLAIRTLGTLPMLAVTLAGVARVRAGLTANKPVGLLIALTAIVGLVTLVLLFNAAEQSRAGARQVDELRSRYAHLSPVANPSMATYGAAGAALSVGLFGTMALWAADPAFAANVAMVQSTGSGGSSDGGGCGGSSSSCGGGGGCGGGGCGG